MKEDINESIIFFIVALIGYLYYRYNNPNQVIDRYYKENSEREYYMIKYSVIFLKIMMVLNFRYLLIFTYKKFIKN